MSGMNANSIGIRRNLKIDTSILPVKYEVTTENSIPLEVARMNLNVNENKLITVQARCRDNIDGSQSASIIFTQRIGRDDLGVPYLDLRVDNHTIKTSDDINAYLEVLQIMQIFSSWQYDTGGLGSDFVRAFTIIPLTDNFDIVLARKSTLDPNYSTTFLTESDILAYLSSQPSPVDAYGSQGVAPSGASDFAFNASLLGPNMRGSAFLVDSATNTICYKVGDIVTGGSSVDFTESDRFSSTPPNHVLYVKGLDLDVLNWVLTVGKV